jgi:hypothetical protein
LGAPIEEYVFGRERSEGQLLSHDDLRTAEEYDADSTIHLIAAEHQAPQPAQVEKAPDYQVPFVAWLSWCSG